MADGSRDSAPVDFDVLDDMGKYLARSNRFPAEVDHPSINWASDVEFDGEIPH